ncbi:hypothetical protein V8B55DRAFT_1563211 [Mucor lusitanicus]
MYVAAKSIESEEYLMVDFIAKKNVNGALLARQIKKIRVINNFKPIELYQFLQIFKRVTVVNLTAKRKKDTEDGANRLDREASPVSVIMEPLKAALLQYEERLRKVTLSPNSCIPPALRKFGIARQYRSASLSLPNIISGETTDDAVSLLGSTFVESILLSNEGHYVLITQLEVYCKDSAVDDTSINNLKLSTLDHEKRVVVAVERKTAQKVAWHELKLYYQKYELLITGALEGPYKSDAVDSLDSGGATDPRAIQRDLSQQRSRKRRAEEDDDDENEEDSHSRIRDVSPVSAVMEPLKAALVQYEQRLRSVSLSADTFIPQAVSKLGIPRHYRTMMVGQEGLYTKETLEENVRSLGSAFVESILVSNEGEYVLVTQLEVYYKDRELDDTSINNVQVSNNEHYKRPVVVVERKTAQKSAWYELKIYIANFELLVTGAVYGRSQDNLLQCFLESSKAPTALMQQSNWIVIAPETPVRCQKDFRLLQSFRNNASTFEWAFKSQKFVDKGSDEDIVEAIRKDRKLGKYKKWMLDFIFNKTRDSTNEELVLLYKQLLYSKLRATHDRRMKLLK